MTTRPAVVSRLAIVPRELLGDLKFNTNLNENKTSKMSHAIDPIDRIIVSVDLKSHISLFNRVASESRRALETVNMGRSKDPFIRRRTN
jgi:hypothetical protein